MKVVLFCGGQGLRMRGYSESIPKPMVKIGNRPILWHIMKYYAHFGHKDFVLCLGWNADQIKNYFLNYDECVSNDFVLSGGGRDVKLLASDIDDWNITFCDTGMSASVGERLRAIQQHVAGESMFFANYADGLSDVNLNFMVDYHTSKQAIATLLAVRPTQSFHMVESNEDGTITDIEAVASSGVRMNGGFFVFSQQIFDYLEQGKDIIDGLDELTKIGKCYSVNHEGFWGCMDTYKEFQTLEEMYALGKCPWATWKMSPQNAESNQAGMTL